MPRNPAQRKETLSIASYTVANMERWKLEDAKARLSEVVRLAGTAGPQLLTIRGKEAAEILAPEQYKELLAKLKSHKPLVQFLQGLGLSSLDVERKVDTGRDISL